MLVLVRPWVKAQNALAPRCPDGVDKLVNGFFFSTLVLPYVLLLLFLCCKNKNVPPYKINYYYHYYFMTKNTKFRKTF